MNYYWIGDNLELSIELNEINNDDINELRKFENIEYVGEKISDDENKTYHVFMIKNVKNITIKKLIKNIFEEAKTQENNIVSIFKEIYNLFKFNRIADKEKQLRGDIAEILFLKFLEKHNIDWTKYYISNKNEFDVQAPNLNIEIKSYSNAIKAISVSWKQLIPADNKKRYFIVIEVQNTTNKNNILTLINSLKYQNGVTQEKLEYWEKYHLDFLNSITADETNKICYFNNDLLPHINIEPNNTLTDITFKLSITEAMDYKINDIAFSNLDELSEILEHIN